MDRPVQWERMFPEQLERAFAECPVLYLPYGICEPHGPHAAFGLDALKAHAICIETARQHGGIVAPPDYWHIHEVGGYAIWAARAVGEVERTWLTAMPPWQHFKNTLYHVRQADALGFKAAILLTGHYGPNWEDLKTLLRLIQPHVGTRLYGLPDFEANQPGFDPENPGRGGDHAGKVETSLLWAVDPDCVDMSRVPSEPGTHLAMGKDVRESNRRTGERMVEDEVKFLSNKARELLADYDRLQPRHAMTTFLEAERVWEEVVKPELPNFRTMQEHWNNGDLPPEGSIWRRNMRIK